MKKQIEVGEEFTVDFMINRNGGKPVCRIDGIVGFIDKSTKDFVTPSSTWMVSVTAVFDSFVYVKPLVKIRTPKENGQITKDMLSKLKSEHTSKQVKVKIKKGYQYKSFAELQNGTH